MRKTNGFTLVELLAVIVILAIILVIAVPSVSNLIDSVKLSAYKNDEQIMVKATKTFVGLNDNYLPVNLGDTKEVKLSDLQSNDFIGMIRDPNNNGNTCSGYVLITKIGTASYDYTPFLKCGSSNTIDGYEEDGLMAYWKLDGNAYDYSPNNKHGTLTDTTSTVNRFNQASKALSFNGASSSISIPLMNYPQMSLTAWFYRNVKDLSNADSIFGSWNWSENVQEEQGYDLRFYINSDAIEFLAITQTSGGVKTERYCYGDLGSNSVNHWHYVVATYDQATGQQRLYIDGNLVDQVQHTANNTIVPFTNYPDAKIGYSRVNYGNFDGTIDDVSFYNRALTADEVKNNYYVEKSRSN